MIVKSWLTGFLALALAVSAAGCGGAPTVQPWNGPQAMQAAETVPSEMELKRLEARSPDRLVDDAAPEPGSTDLWPKPPKEDLGNFGKLNDTLFRGARPTEKGIQQLVSMGVKTIINLENSRKPVEQERQWAEKYGLKFHNIPMSVITPPKLAKIEQFFSIVNDPASGPVYFHCMQGRDRTGTMAFCYRVSQQGWTGDDAYAEMKRYKFHTYLLGLRWFVKKYAKDHSRTPPTTDLAFSH